MVISKKDLHDNKKENIARKKADQILKKNKADRFAESLLFFNIPWLLAGVKTRRLSPHYHLYHRLLFPAKSLQDKHNIAKLRFNNALIHIHSR